MNSIFQLHKNSNFSARKDGASQTTPFFFIFPFRLATVRTKLFYKQTDIGTSLLCAIMSLPDKLGYENSMGKATFWIFALLSPVWLVSIKKQPKEKRKKKQTKEHRLDCKNKNRSKASHLVLSFSIKRHSWWLLIQVLFNTFMLLTQSILSSCYSRITVLGKQHTWKQVALLIAVKSAFPVRPRSPRAICFLPGTYSLLILCH